MKAVAHIKLIKLCKTSNVILKFANLNVSTQYGSYKLKKLFAGIIIKNQLRLKYQ